MALAMRMDEYADLARAAREERDRILLIVSQVRQMAFEHDDTSAADRFLWTAACDEIRERVTAGDKP